MELISLKPRRRAGRAAPPRTFLCGGRLRSDATREPLKRAQGGGAAVSAGARWERWGSGCEGALRDRRCSPRSTAAAMSREPEIMESQVMWEPDTKRNTHMDRFRAAVASSCGLRLGERWAGAGGRFPGLWGPGVASSWCEAHPCAAQLSVPVGTRAPPGAGGQRAAGGMLCLSQRPPGQHPLV